MTRRAAPVASGGRPARAGDDRMLDAFAARAAHALGAGVSIAGGYSTLLRERYADVLGAEGNDALAALDGGIGRVRLFVDDLLELSAIDTASLRREPLRPSDAAHAAAEGLTDRIEDARADVTIEPLPDVIADPELLERMFHHLLRGALAAIGSGPGEIAVTGVRRAAGVRLSIADTGTPLDQATALELFEPFATPRGSGPVAGASVSMAIARRIAERHGGSIWAHTGRRDGCTIVVLLPESAG
jgi:light-regulated signal transduction histidine kinase (bacteriophytochrome)